MGKESSSKKPKRGKRAQVDKEYVKKVIKILKENYPDAKTALKYKNPFQLLVATILSAQCTDERVNKVTGDLFSKYRTPKDFSEAELEDIKEIIYSTGFYNNKAKNIKAMSEKIVSDYGGKVPDTMDEMLTLPGVARKTANVVLGSAFGKAVGIVVDTHVLRLSYRLGLTTIRKNAKKAEKELMEIIPENDWIWFAHALIRHGRKICKSRKPDCESCQLNCLCPSSFSFD